MSYSVLVKQFIQIIYS